MSDFTGCTTVCDNSNNYLIFFINYKIELIYKKIDSYLNSADSQNLSC